MKIKLALFIVVLLFAASCKKKADPLANYDRTALLSNMADSVIVPAYSNFKTGSDNLQTAADAFVATPDANSLAALQVAWNNDVTAWMQCEVYNLGYANTNSMGSQIASTPANFEVIEGEIHSAIIIDDIYMASTGTTRKGLAAIEYLLYGNNTSQQAVLDSFSTSAFATRRKAYLTALCHHISANANAVYNDWNHSNSYNTFLSQSQLDISGSLNLLVNSLVEHIELVRKGKVGKPSGIDNGGIVDGTLCEYRLTPRTLENIKQNIQAWKDIYTGKTGTGLDDYLDHVNAQYNGALLSATIQQQLDVCLAKANEITVPLHLAVTQQPAQVTALHLELKKLTVLTKVDLASNLGVTITFSDNDGD
jgi:hypothetical protein